MLSSLSGIDSFDEQDIAPARPTLSDRRQHGFRFFGRVDLTGWPVTGEARLIAAAAGPRRPRSYSRKGRAPGSSSAGNGGGGNARGEQGAIAKRARMCEASGTSSTGEQHVECESCGLMMRRCVCCGGLFCRCEVESVCGICGVADECPRQSCNTGGTSCAGCHTFMHWHCGRTRCRRDPRHRFCAGCSVVCPGTCAETLCPVCGPDKCCLC